MNNIKCIGVFFLVVVGVCLGLGGCMGKSPPPNFYILTPIQAEQQALEFAGSKQNSIIGIGPITLANYIDQPRIVTRSGDNQLVRAEFELWAGSFKDMITNVLSENIGVLLSTEQIYIYPWRLSVPIDYQIQLDIVSFDGVLGKEVRLVARWSIYKGPDKKIVATKRSSIIEPVTNQSYAAYASAQSKALSQLSHEIGRLIQKSK